MELFSRRQKRIRGDFPDIYQYHDIPNSLRVQIIHIIRERINRRDEYYGRSENTKEDYKFIVDALCREYGVFILPPSTNRYQEQYDEELFNFFLQIDDPEKCIDVIELCFRFIDKITDKFEYRNDRSARENADDAIRELNQRLKDNGVGYEYVEGEIIRIDSQLIHSEVVKPALRLLNVKMYRGAHEEFISAYDHYRHGNHKEALNDCLKSFESAMKSICEKRGWAYNKGDTASKLIKILFDNGLVPDFWQTQLSSLRSLLESSIPTGRNKLSGHGQGSIPVVVPDYLTAYMLHMTASTLVFLTTADEKL